jgi:hypothetical protein
LLADLTKKLDVQIVPAIGDNVCYTKKSKVTNYQAQLFQGLTTSAFL